MLHIYFSSGVCATKYYSDGHWVEAYLFAFALIEFSYCYSQN